MDITLTATVLIENAQADGLASEHGLSVLLHYKHADSTTIVLLDFGQSDAFARNARTLGIDLSTVDAAMLSHAHYDHADGMPAFFAINDHAPLYLSEACTEACWSTKAGMTEPHYIGIKPGLLEAYAKRMTFIPTGQPTLLAPGIHLVPHTTPGLDTLGAQAGMLIRKDDALVPDTFAHEVSLVCELAPASDGTARIALFNSCSHAGLPVIAAEACSVFPGAQIAAYVGGLHLVHASDEQILQVAEAVNTAGIACLHTGHCTGTHAFDLLQHTLPGRVCAIRPGTVLSL